MSGMPTTATRRYTLTLDGHPPMPVAEFEMEPPPVTYVRSEGAAKPSTLWRHTDEHGHEHRWVDGELPTLTATTRHVECDGSCGGVCEGEGYDVTVWHCSACGDEVEPGRVPDYAARNVGTPIVTGPATGWATVRGRPLGFGGEPIRGVLASDGEEVAVRASLHDVRSSMDSPLSSVLFLTLEPAS